MEVENNEVDGQQGVVAAHLKCLTSEAKHLCVLDPGWKLKTKGDYDIGGTYSDGPEFWFLYRTQSYLQNNLMSLFVCNRRAGSFTITLGGKKTVPQNAEGESEQAGKFLVEFNETPDYIDFYNLPKDTFSFVKTYCFSNGELDILENKDLLIEIHVECDQLNLSPDVVARVKLTHDFSKLLEEPDRSDLILESSDGRMFPVHKVIVAANSSFFRSLLESPSTNHVKLDEAATDVECLLQFLYTGSIRNFNKVESINLMNMGTKYNIRGLTQLSQHTLLRQICVDNAVDVLRLAHEYQLKLLQREVIHFIRDNPAVFSTNAWINLKNVEIAKELFQYISTAKE